MRKTSKTNEGRLLTYLQNHQFKNGKPRKHPKGTKPGVIAEGYQKYIITVKTDLLERMKRVAFHNGIKIKAAFEEAIEDYIKKFEK